MYDVFGIGNPMLDIVIKVDDHHILDLDVKKGHITFVDEETSTKILESFGEHERLFIPGGDVVNTLTGITNLGGTTIFCGKVGVDNHGILLEETMIKDNVKPVLIKGDKKTATGICLVTPDSERTFIDHLGAAITLKAEELILEDVKNSKVLYITGYVLEEPNLRTMSLRALDEAKKLGKIIAIDVSDPSLVSRCKDDLKEIIKKYADIVFANEEEVFELTGKKEEEGLAELSTMANVAIVKLGKKGCLINDNGAIHIIPGFKVKAIDSTGAGDMFAAGFLFGLTNDYTAEEAGLIGNFAASKVVEQTGARLNTSLKSEVEKLFK